MARIQITRRDDFSSANLERIYALLDRMHDAAAEGHLPEMTNWTNAEMIEYLMELGFTIEEIIREIRAAEARVQAAMKARIIK